MPLLRPAQKSGPDLHPDFPANAFQLMFPRLVSVTALITLAEYGSYDCSHYRATHERIAVVRQQSGQQLRYVVRHWPISGVRFTFAFSPMASATMVPWDEHSLADAILGALGHSVRTEMAAAGSQCRPVLCTSRLLRHRENRRVCCFGTYSDSRRGNPVDRCSGQDDTNRTYRQLTFCYSQPCIHTHCAVPPNSPTTICPMRNSPWPKAWTRRKKPRKNP